MISDHLGEESLMTIYEEIGGAPAVGAAVDAFYDRVTSDPTLTNYFDSVNMGRLKGHMRAFIAAAVGGPDPYLGRDMETAHAHLEITDQAFDAVVAHLVAVLDSLGVSEGTIGAIGTTLAPLKAEIVTVSSVA